LEGRLLGGFRGCANRQQLASCRDVASRVHLVHERLQEAHGIQLQLQPSGSASSIVSRLHRAACSIAAGVEHGEPGSVVWFAHAGVDTGWLLEGMW
jgi:hypothetical protein